MKLQRDSYSCGVYAIINAAKCLGIDLTRRDITKFSKTSREKGTSEKGILKALKCNNLSGKEFTFKSQKEAVEFIDNLLKFEKPVILAVDNDSHWCTIIGTFGKKYIMFDSDRSKYNKEESGVHLLSSEELDSRWKNENNKYYCIVVEKCLE
jgi:ABC-type bacteriocin/lantibiotic exporter with double-glycine peptidase domain